MRAVPIALSLAAAVWAATGCGDSAQRPDSGTGNPDGGVQAPDGGNDGGTDGGGVNPDAGSGDAWIPLISRTFTAGPHSYNNHACRLTQAEADMLITGFRSTTHPNNFRSIVSISDSSEGLALGDFDCTAGVMFSRVIYGFASGTTEQNDFDFPPDIGIHVNAGQFILLNMACYDDSFEHVTITASVLAHNSPAATVTNEAEMVLSGTRNLARAFGGIPSDNFPHKYSGGCSEPFEFQIFSIWPTMNGIATHQELRLNGTVYADRDYSAAQQTIDPVSIAVHKDDQLTITCTYINNTGIPVLYGDGFNAEVCYAGVYRYPRSATGNPFDCVSN